MTVDRSFYKEPPACLNEVKSFVFKCTPDPQKPGYCIETLGATSVTGAEAITDRLLCAQRVAEWVKIEREARAGNGPSS